MFLRLLAAAAERWNFSVVSKKTMSASERCCTSERASWLLNNFRIPFIIVYVTIHFFTAAAAFMFFSLFKSLNLQKRQERNFFLWIISKALVCALEAAKVFFRRDDRHSRASGRVFNSLKTLNFFGCLFLIAQVAWWRFTAKFILANVKMNFMSESIRNSTRLSLIESFNNI